METPTEIINAAFAALNLEDWPGFAELCDPVSLRAFKREILDDFCCTSSESSQADPDDLEDEPEHIREAIKHDLAILDEWFNPINRLKTEFASVKSLAELQEMDAARMFARWLRTKHALPEIRDDIYEGKRWKTPQTRVSDKTTCAYRYSTMGFVLDSEKVAYVVYRNDMSPNDAYPGVMDEWEKERPADEAQLGRDTHYLRCPQVATCRKQDDGSWRLVVGRDFSLVGTLQTVEVHRT